MELLNRMRGNPWRAFARLSLLLGVLGVCLQGEEGSEYKVKAAFLYKFASFVEWPHDELAVPVGICVAGRDPFGEALERVVRGKTINGREFLIRRLKNGEAPADCHILFISDSERRRLRPFLDRLQGAPVLTVSDLPGFCETGGVVHFAMADNRVQLEINPSAAERAGLLLSSRLLALARIVRDEGGAK